ncbi:hypothetical protein [Pedobacter sp. CFBP9032]|uniref:hypothetical protein n=1 Tax=Pedobacter sp. CFBP9032 TaxID=3096539 RepID=UPI002A69CC0E|nr:hypothetical protein [Pedobacter sp. CFBP9032]MDY0905641.1 hypothetical protein [Pedobacter sp. CFBP9032]
MNYPLIIAVSVLVLILIVFLIKRNLKDQKKFEEEIIDAELPPDKEEKENI